MDSSHRIFPMLSNPIAEVVRLAEADIIAFEARMREVIPAYGPGDRVELHGEEFEVSSYHARGCRATGSREARRSSSCRWI